MTQFNLPNGKKVMTMLGIFSQPLAISKKCMCKVNVCEVDSERHTGELRMDKKGSEFVSGESNL